MKCSKGTYIRTLCHDIGQSLGCGGCMSALRRVRAGEFSIENACTLDQVREAADRGEAEKLLLPVDSLFRQDPALSLNARDEKRIRSGGVFPVAVQDGQYRAYGSDGAFLALVRVTGGELKSIKSFFEV